LTKTIGIDAVAVFAAGAAAGPPAKNHGDRTMYQISRQGREAIVLTFRPAVFDFHILAVDEADLIQALTKCGHDGCSLAG
jgi:hypothetical protein